jgi:hypothetical protein
MSGKRWALVYTGILRPLLGAPRTALRDNPMWILRGAIPCYEHDSSRPSRRVICWARGILLQPSVNEWRFFARSRGIPS